MSEEEKTETVGVQPDSLAGGTYEVIRNRLDQQSSELKKRLDNLNDRRKEIFGSIETELAATESITTEFNCIPRDLVPLNNQVLFGYNIHMGLKNETRVEDVFSLYEERDGHFIHVPLDILGDENFIADFKALYKYYKNTEFARFAVRGPYLFMVFQIGRTADEVKCFKWSLDHGKLTYIDNRSDHEYKYPNQHEFAWSRTHRDLHRKGDHPHITIEDEIFVECIGGDLTIKVEDNTDSGKGIYSEPVEDESQTLDDADFFYAKVGNIIIIKAKPYREDRFRYLAYNSKTQDVKRLDSIGHSCVLLPEDQGIIFQRGYFLQNGDSKTFDAEIKDMLFERRLTSPNGEDYLYVFHARNEGEYVLLPYNIIEQKVDSLIYCHGFSILSDGRLIYFKSLEEATKHHTLQIWKTPFLGPDQPTPVGAGGESHLTKVGNRDIVRCMSECREVINLISRGESYEGVYSEITRMSNDIIDAYFWVDHEEAGNIKEVLTEIQQTSASAIEEFDKVRRIKKSTQKSTTSVLDKAEKLFMQIRSTSYDSVDQFVKTLHELRALRGETVSLKELKYVNIEKVEQCENKIAEENDRLAQGCVEFLLKPDALTPYEKKIDVTIADIPNLKSGMKAKELEEKISGQSGELELLTEIVSNLKIEDPTKTTEIIDRISALYSKLNQSKTALRRKKQELGKAEGEAEFHAQIKLLEQSLVNYLDVADTPDKCDDFLTKMMVQLEELEGKFADFDEYVVQLAEKREELSSAFESRRLGLEEARQKKASSLMRAAERILKGIRGRLEKFKSVDEINAFYASDLMVDKVRNIAQDLIDMSDTVRADDLLSRLKSSREDSVRQLKDKLELFVDGEDIIQFGSRKFSVNRQKLDLTMIHRDDEMFFHLAGTGFFEEVEDEEFESTREVWAQDRISENQEVYRAEYLAYIFYRAWARGDLQLDKAQYAEMNEEELRQEVSSFMAPRYEEGYMKGVHDFDAAKIASQLLRLHQDIGLLRFSPRARAIARLFWHQWDATGKRQSLERRCLGFGLIRDQYGDLKEASPVIEEIHQVIDQFIQNHNLGDTSLSCEAAEYLFEILSNPIDHPTTHAAYELLEGFHEHLIEKGLEGQFNSKAQDIGSADLIWYELIIHWLKGYAKESELPEGTIEEAAAKLYCDPRGRLVPSSVQLSVEIEGLKGAHITMPDGHCTLHFNQFCQRLEKFTQEQVPLYQKYQSLKKEKVIDFRESLRLDEFTPRVLTSFVRNRLLDEVFLPLIGDNLAKQIGEAGEGKRTDRSGLLLLISPPGYGKTTLMEYIADRLGITFVKINGPAIGHQVTSLDPAEAPNASAKEEVKKLGLALEMGDNVMIYLDDIQHCNPEFLQKFISLCDAQRRIEGVWKEKPRTYDLRGKKVAVVMAGNPYTESGEKFRIPDMLANRADTYNLGDIIGGKSRAFELSYLENAMTSNATLRQMASRSQKDVYELIRLAETDDRDGADFEGNYSGDEISEMISVMKKLLVIRDTILAVNLEYIRSAAQADAYRTEPAFKLQGSYRNMNRMTEKVLPIMNDQELESLILSHYENESQTLTTGAEANMLKFKKMTGRISPEEEERWEGICKTFKRNVLLGAAGGDDQLSRVIAQLSGFGEGLESIKETIALGIDKMDEPDVTPVVPQSSSKEEIQIVNKIPRALSNLIRDQYKMMTKMMQPVLKTALEQKIEMNELKEALSHLSSSYKDVVGRIIDDQDIEEVKPKKRSSQRKKKTALEKKFEEE